MSETSNRKIERAYLDAVIRGSAFAAAQGGEPRLTGSIKQKNHSEAALTKFGGEASKSINSKSRKAGGLPLCAAAKPQDLRNFDGVADVWPIVQLNRE